MLHFSPTAATANNQCNYLIQPNHKKSGDHEPMSHAGGYKHCCCLTITKTAKDCASSPKVCHTQPDTEVVLLHSSTPAGETSLGRRETGGLGESGSIVPGPDSQAGEVLAVGGPLHRWAHTLKGR